MPQDILLPNFAKRLNQKGGVPDGIPTILVPFGKQGEIAFGMSDEGSYLQSVASGMATFFLPSGARVCDTTRKIRAIHGDCDLDALAFMMGEEFNLSNTFLHELPVHSPIKRGHREPLKGLAVVAVMNVETGHPLMVGYANDQALALTLEQQRVVLWSTSRNELQVAGATSGNSLEIYDVTQDLSGHFIIYWVQNVGHLACHLEARSCFFHDMLRRELIEVPPKLAPDYTDTLKTFYAEVRLSLLIP